MADKRITNAEAVDTYHGKLVNLAVVRVPNADESGIDFKGEVYAYLVERYGLKREKQGKEKYDTPNKSMNEYILDLINEDMQRWYAENTDTKREAVQIKKGVKEVKATILTDAM